MYEKYYLIHLDFSPEVHLLHVPELLPDYLDCSPEVQLLHVRELLPELSRLSTHSTTSSCT